MPPGSFTFAPAMHTSRAFTTEPTMHPVGGVVEAPVVTAYQVGKPVRAMGDLFAMGLDGMVLTFKPPFAWREYLLQTWFVARVSMLPALMMTLPYSVILTFIFNILLTEIGAGDLSGTGAAIGTVNQIAPIVTVLVVSGAGATASCAVPFPWSLPRSSLRASPAASPTPIRRPIAWAITSTLSIGM